ncbi:MAG: hypothetical protein J2P21_24890 [Chloracidobacterium sp.]|nr:hypothetical protein [Chloracidobacterium sp.]
MILATAFSDHAKEESNYKRLQRFLREFAAPYAQLALFIVSSSAFLGFTLCGVGDQKQFERMGY